MFHKWEKIGVWSPGELNYKPILKCSKCKKRIYETDKVLNED